MTRYGYTLGTLLAEDAHELLAGVTNVLDPHLGMAD
jgi:hypothetical protein